MQETRELIKASDRSPSGTVFVGVPMSLLEVFAIPLIKRLRERYPDIHHTSRRTSSFYLRELVINGRLDMAVTLQGEEHKGLKSKLIATEELYFAGHLPASHVRQIRRQSRCLKWLNIPWCFQQFPIPEE